MSVDSQKSISPEEIGRAYDQITERWTSSAFPRSNGIAAHRRAIDFLKTRESALDIGCGANGRFFDLFSAWDSIWHIPLAEHERVFKKVLSALAPNSVFIFTTGGVDEPGEKIDDSIMLKEISRGPEERQHATAEYHPCEKQ